ncbi:hypothetical protein IID62_07165 [candidate division KSB1 bacterium]|nr:hypothetical protein [candidate division KSB1 bacterium]
MPRLPLCGFLAKTDNYRNVIIEDESKPNINILRRFEIILCVKTVIANPVSEAKRGVAISWLKVRYK